MHHKRIGSSLHPTIVYTFSCKLYDIINRIKNSGSDFFHRNLKPSNVFYHLKEGEVEWRISEWGLITNHINKYYSKPIQASMKKSNHSFTKDYFEGDLYSLGVIIL